MSGLSEVSVLISQSAADIEMAREVFTTETRRFVESILEAIRRARSDPWTSGRVRVDLPREIETEPKAAAYMSSQFAFARVELKFKKQTRFVVIAGVPFGFDFDDAAGAFRWRISLVPAARYPSLDNAVWRYWRANAPQPGLPGASHQEKANTIQFVSRPITKEVTPEIAFSDVKTVLEFLLAADMVLAESVGLDLTPDEEISSENR
jgi:hypothetical protein